jgi:hypothetical protein
MQISQTGVGTATHDTAIRDTFGHALLPIQAEGDGATTFRVLGRVAPEAPFEEIVAAATANFLQSISWVPYIQLEVTAGTGTVTLWIGEQ